MTFEQWRDEFLGKGIDFDGKYSFQCVDVYRSYVARVLGFPQSPGVAGAADIWTTYLPSYFTRVSNSPQAVPGKGDICIWKKAKSNGNYGHVAIVEKADLNTLTILEQDGLTNSVLKRRTTNYTNVLLATPFAIATLIPPEFPQAIRVGMNANKSTQRP